MSHLYVLRRTHFLKCWPPHFAEVRDGRKPFEVRNATDRCFQAGDILILQEWDPRTEEFTGFQNTQYVLAVYHDLPGVLPEHVVMSISAKDPLETNDEQESAAV